MKAALIFTGLLALAPSFAQEPQKAMNVPAGLTINGGLRIQPQTFRELEKKFDDRISKAGLPDPMYLLGSTRGIYLDGYGAVFTTEIDLVQTLRGFFFRTTIEPPEVAAIHKRKLDHVPLLKSVMTNMVNEAAITLLQVPKEQKIVVIVRILYMPWENTAGLPAQIVMSADRASALAGNIKVEEQ